jgi:LPPG:FO 2-phospho-L-lactate transferase
MIMNILALAGGVGGAKLADGLARQHPPDQLTVVVNTADDFEHLGLYISPDLDTVCYTLAGLADPERGWGRKGETWTVLESVGSLGGPTWFQLGDLDLGTHLERTRLMKEGHPLSEIAARFCATWGIPVRVLPMSDRRISTRVITELGELAFQDYFVARRCEPIVKGFRFEVDGQAVPAPGVAEAFQSTDVIIICPSNPWVSIDPILSVNGVRPAMVKKPVIGVSPIIGGKTIKGPAAKMYAELGVTPSATAVAEHYQALLTGFVLDIQDASEAPGIRRKGIETLVVDTVMRNDDDRMRFADEVISFSERILTP